MMLLACLLFGASVVTAQTSKVAGIVTSASDGEPVIGASVAVKGNATLGAVTDLNGKFEIANVPSSAKTLVVSYVGMATQEVAIKPYVKVVLEEDSEVLDEVMVVAFGTTKKQAFTGSAAVVGAEQIDKHVATNVANTLVGSVAGLQMRGSSGQPGAGAGSINIRGIASMYAGTDPLVIVDGAPYTASLSNIPNSDIESVSVLKDAASAALYGARGAAGVIIITTKKGSTANAKVNVDMKWGQNSRAIRDYDVIKNPAEFYEAYFNQVYNYAQNVGGYDNARATTYVNNRLAGDLGYVVYDVPNGQSLIGTNGKLNPNAKLGTAYTDPASGETYYLQPDDWTKTAYHNALRQEYNVSVSGGNDKTSFYTSVGYLNEDGIIDYSGYERISARIKADYQAKKWLKLGANVGFVNSAQTSNPNMSTEWGSTNLMYYTTFVAPIYPIYVRTLDANGNPVIRTDEFGHQQYDYGVAATNYPGHNRAFLQTGNPLGSNRYNDNTSRGNQFNGTVFADINITDQLKANVTSTVIWGETQQSVYDNPFYGPKAGVNGSLSKSVSTGYRTNNIQSLTYSNDFGPNSVSAMIGHEYYRTESHSLSASMYGGFSPDIKELNAFATMNGIASSSSLYNVEGFFANANYNYNEKYYGSASFRRDASSYFAPENRWGNFWSVGGAWIINKESFMASAKWVDLLKLKVSIGQQGNDNTAAYAYIDTYDLSKASETTMSPTFRLKGNPEITWETTTNANVGVEFGFWKNRLTGNIDVYNKKVSDQLFWLSVPESAGTRGYYGNVGDIRNRGIEAQLTGAIIHTKDFDWSISGNASFNKTKILSLPDAKIADNGGYYESPYWYEVGGELYNYMNYAYAGVDPETGEALYWYDENLSNIDKDGNPILNEDGTQRTNTINKPGKEYSGKTKLIGNASRYTRNGSILPKVFGGFSTTVRYKNFDFSATFDYQIGGKMYDSQYAKLMTPAVSGSDFGYNYHKDWAKSWSADNKNTEIPRWQYGDQYTSYGSDRFLISASYLNFQSFTVGYTLPAQLTRKAQIASARIYAAGENLWFWSARKGLDPRYSYESTASTAVYSPVRNISGGIQLTF